MRALGPIPVPRASSRTPKPIAELQKDNPAIYKQFKDISDKLEKHYKDMQDMEFTIEKGTGHLTVPFIIDEAELWWPNGMGDQHLYTFRMELYKN